MLSSLVIARVQQIVVTLVFRVPDMQDTLSSASDFRESDHIQFVFGGYCGKNSQFGIRCEGAYVQSGDVCRCTSR